MAKELAFIPGRTRSKDGLLARFLPPIPEGVASAWLSNNLASGSWVLDPFGALPELAIEAALAGYQVLVAANNPILRFMLGLWANPPSEEELRAALAELASSRIGEERLEIHLQRLYMTNCTQCNKPTIAQAFLWKNDESVPFAKIYECNHCGDSGVHPVTQSDIDLANSFSASSLHRMRVLERIAPSGDSYRAKVEDAISIYLPRAIYGLVMLINKLDGLLIPSSHGDPDESIRRRSLIALVLSALDKGNNLWTYPSGRTRPKQLSASPRFRENNIWIALEKAVEQLARNQEKIPFTIFPQIPEERRGLVLYEGPLRDFCQRLSTPDSKKVIDFGAILTAFPRHNQAFWTLSALWSGWIWGREAIGPFKSVLRRRRYDWAWYSSALNNAFNSLSDLLPSGIPFFGLIGEAEPHFLSASVVSTRCAGFELEGLALRAESGLAQLHWNFNLGSPSRTLSLSSEHMQNKMREEIILKGVEHLKQRGEPAPYLTLYTSALKTIEENPAVCEKDLISSSEEFNRVHSLVEEALSLRNGFIRFGGGEKSPETSQLWHQDLHKPTNLLTDRIEATVIHYIQNNPGCRKPDLDEYVCAKFSGLMTPAFDLITTIASSYNEEALLEKDVYYLREQDEVAIRNKEVIALRNDLITLSERLGLSSQGDDPIIWRDDNDRIRLVFYLIPSASLGEIVFSNPFPPDKSIIILPGARANLMMYKLRHNPYLRQEIDQGWRFLKFRHFRHLMESPSLRRENLDDLLALDPLTESPAQMRLL
jgi:hypothetical protein